MENNQNIFDITIVGGGPAGLYSAFYAGMRQASVKIIESLPQLGGQLAALYPEKYIYDFPGFQEIKAQDLVVHLQEQMKQFNPTLCLNETVMDISKTDDIFTITTDKGTHISKTVILAVGNGAFSPRRLDIPSEAKFENKNLHYFINNMSQFQDRNVVIFGGGDSAVDWSLMLEPVAKSVTIVHRREQFRAHEGSVEKLLASKVTVKTPYVAVELLGEDQLEKVVIESVTTKELETIEADDVIVNYGFLSSVGTIKEWGIEIQKNAIPVNSKMETNVEGIYAVGDVCSYDGKHKIIVAALGEAPRAVNHAKTIIDPTAKAQPLHSSALLGKKDKK